MNLGFQGHMRTVVLALIATLTLLVSVVAVSAGAAHARDGTDLGVVDHALTPSAPPNERVTQEQDATPLNSSVRQMISIAERSAVSGALSGRTVNIHVTLDNGSTATWGAKFSESGNVTAVQKGGFSTRHFDARTSEPTVRSIVASNASSQALTKAVTYDLLRVKGVGMTADAVTGIGSAVVSRAGKARTQSARVDVDDDGRDDAILEVEGQNKDRDATFESQVNTVLRDVDDDGEMETVSSTVADVKPSIQGIAKLDTNADKADDTVVSVRGTDPDADGTFDRRTKTKLADTNHDSQFDSISKAVDRISPARNVRAQWDLTEDGRPDVRVAVEGEDTDGDGRFDKKTTTVFLNIDGEPGFDTRSATTATVKPTLSMSAEFDTDDDGRPESTASLTGTDSDSDGTLDEKSTRVTEDTDGDGEPDRIVSQRECRRGFIKRRVCDGYGGFLGFFLAPKNLSRIGSLASILGALRELQKEQ